MFENKFMKSYLRNKLFSIDLFIKFLIIKNNIKIF